MLIVISQVTTTTAGISPVHDASQKLNMKTSDKFLNAPYRVLKHLDNSVFKTSKNVTDNPQTEETLYQISKDLVSAILSKLEIQDKITRITREALEAPGKSKGITAIETRRILDYISRTLSGHILSITRASTEPELHRLVYGLGQIAAEVSIVSALKDITYATALSKKQSVDLSLRKKRAALADIPSTTSHGPPVIPSSTAHPILHSIIINKSLSAGLTKVNLTEQLNPKPRLTPYSIISRNEKKPVNIMNMQRLAPLTTKGFLNQTVLDMENAERNANNTDPIVVEKSMNGTHFVSVDAQTLDAQEFNAPGLMDDFADPRDSLYKSAMSADVAADLEIDQPDNAEDEAANEKKQKQKLERLELKAKKAILYAGDVAYLTAASVVAMRRALTASIEVEMSVKYAKNGMSNHQDLMMNLAKTAAQQAGKEAKSATSKSLASERVIKLALKYTAQSHGANLNHVANRIVMDTISLATLAKSMAFVSSDIAINSLYQATDVKPPS